MERVVESGRANGEGCRVGGRMERVVEWEGEWRGL